MKFRAFWGVAVLGAAVALVGLAAQTNAIPTRSLLNLQGRLTDKNGDPVTGDHRFDLRIYDAETNGTKVFEETQDTVPVSQGIYNILVGNGTGTLGRGADGGLAPDIFKASSLWIEIEVDLDNPLTPRTPLVSSAYAQSTRLLDGTSASAFLAPSGNVTAANLDLLVNGAQTNKHVHKGGRNYDFSKPTTGSNWDNGSGNVTSNRYKTLRLTTSGNPVWFRFVAPGHFSDGSHSHMTLHPVVDGSQRNLCTHYDSRHSGMHHQPIYCSLILDGIGAGQHTFDLNSSHSHGGNTIYTSNGYESYFFVEELVK